MVNKLFLHCDVAVGIKNVHIAVVKQCDNAVAFQNGRVAGYVVAELLGNFAVLKAELCFKICFYFYGQSSVSVLIIYIKGDRVLTVREARFLSVDKTDLKRNYVKNVRSDNSYQLYHLVFEPRQAGYSQ